MLALHFKIVFPIFFSNFYPCIDDAKYSNICILWLGVLIYIENEYGNIMSEYGENGKQYVQWCSQLVESYKIGVPWVMCQ